MPRAESFEQAREQALEHEQERLEAVDRRLEVDRLHQVEIARFGQRYRHRLAARHAQQFERAGAQPRGESAARQREQVAHRADAEARERLGERVARVEQVDRERGEEAALAIGGQGEYASACVHLGRPATGC